VNLLNSNRNPFLFTALKRNPEHETNSNLAVFPPQPLRAIPGFPSAGKIKEPAGKDPSVFILVCFWSLNSEESISELNYINANLQNWQSAKPFRFMAVSIDEGKTANRMRPVYNMNGWTFDTYVDLYGDLRRSLHSNNLPQSYILYKNVKIYEQSGWTEGSENYLFHRLTAIKN
jgi:hypothetical protein